MLREAVYVASLLHDIGKLAERAKSYQLADKFGHVSVRHARYSAQLVAEIEKEHNSYFSQFAQDLTDLMLYHHEPYNDWQKIVQLADRMSSAGIEVKASSDQYYSHPLRPVFAGLFGRTEQSTGYKIAPLSISEGFPQSNVQNVNHEYTNLIASLLSEFASVINETQLYYLLEKYLWCIPADTNHELTDISLFDHAKTTAAIALCLYDQYEAGHLTSDGLDAMCANDEKHLMLIKGDLSGIQDFIFRIPGKGAAKSLKGHSVYLNLLTDVAARYLIRQLGLKDANLLYNGGGNFYLLAPLGCKEQFDELRVELVRHLLNCHQGDIYLALDYLALSPKDFNNFSHQWSLISQKVNTFKNKKWSEIGLVQHHDSIFGPIGHGSKDNEHCALCGIERETRSISYNKVTEKSCCNFCASFIELTDDLKDAECLIIKRVATDEKTRVEHYQDVFRFLGFEYRFVKKESVKKEERQFAYLLNDTDFLSEGFAGYKFGAYQLPHVQGDEEGKSTQLTFEEISLKSTGDPKLAMLKLDVDNLGDLFSRGLGNNATISRVTSLSRMLALFFEGYINHLIEIKQWQQHLYVVYSGGDDTFIVGSWDKVICFAQEFYHKFREFTCNHPRVTFSTGIRIFRYDYPLSMSARLTEEALGNAKSLVAAGEQVPAKNRVSLFGEVFSWPELTVIKNFKNLLLEIMANNAKQGKEEAFGRSFLYRIGKSILGFKKILQDSLEGKVNNVRFWRLAYYLRDVARDDAKRLIAEYRNIVLNNLLDKSKDTQVKNIMVIPAAVKWAQMETRQVRRREDER